MSYSYGIKQKYENRTSDAQCSRTQSVSNIRRITTGGVGNYLFQSPLVGKTKERIAKLLCKAEKLNPGALSADDYVQRMWGYWQTGQKEESLINANRALSLDRDNLLALNSIVYLLADAGRYIEARKELDHLGEVSEKISASKKMKRGNTTPLGLAFSAT